MDDVDRTSVVESASSVIFSTDGEGQVTYANAAARELLGREPGEIVGTPCTAYVHPDDLTKTHEAWERVAAGERVCGAQLRVRHHR